MGVEKFTLGELCTIEKGATGILKAIPGKYPLVVTGEERKSHKEFQFDDAAVIIPLVSGTGHGHASIKRLHFQTGKFALGSILCAVIPKDKSKLNAEYLYYFLDLNRENELVERMRGMANVTLPMKEIAKIEIPLPSIDEQLAFVKMYKLLGEKSEDLSLEFRYQHNLVRKLRQQLLNNAVQGKLVGQNPVNEPAGILLHKITTDKEHLIKEKKLKKEKDLLDLKINEIPFNIPDNWVWCKLGQLIYDTESGKSPNCLSEPATGNAWGVIRTTAVQELFFSQSDNKILPQGFIVQDQHKILEGDILITRAGPKNRVGVVCYVENLSLNLILSDKTIRIKHNKAFISSKFIALALNSSLIKPYIEQKMTGMADSQVNITQDNIKQIPIPLPPLDEQYRIVKKLEELTKTCNALENSINQSQQQNDQLLQQVLREALTKTAKQEEQLIEPANLELRSDDKRKALLLAAEIIWQLNQKQTLGHIKLQKLLYLCNRTQKMNLPVNFLKWAMGPYDPDLQKYIDNTLVDNEWFKYEEDSSLKYQPLKLAGGHKADFDKYFASEKTAINHLIQLFENAKSARIEIVATLFHCWDELIVKKQLVNDNSLLAEFYNWSEKKKKHTTEKVIDALRWMETKGLTPIN